MKTQQEKIEGLISDYMDAGEWERLAALLKNEIEKNSNDYWFFINYAIALYYLGFNDKALYYSSKSIAIESRDPFILYHHGIILLNNKKFKEAITYWHKILKMSNQYLFYGKFGGGKRWALSLKNNVRYYEGLAYFYMNDLTNAIKISRMHLRYRKKGIPSFVSKKQVERELFEMVSLQKTLADTPHTRGSTVK